VRGTYGSGIDVHYSRGISGGVLLRRVSVSRERREETVEVMMLTGGARLAARGGRSWVPVRVLREVGRGLDLELGRNVSPGPFLFLFFFPSFLFLFS
jgi:hypothetical protein